MLWNLIYCEGHQYPWSNHKEIIFTSCTTDVNIIFIIHEHIRSVFFGFLRNVIVLHLFCVSCILTSPHATSLLCPFFGSWFSIGRFLLFIILNRNVGNIFPAELRVCSILAFRMSTVRSLTGIMKERKKQDSTVMMLHQRYCFSYSWPPELFFFFKLCHHPQLSSDDWCQLESLPLHSMMGPILVAAHVFKHYDLFTICSSTSILQQNISKRFAVLTKCSRPKQQIAHAFIRCWMNTFHFNVEIYPYVIQLNQWF